MFQPESAYLKQLDLSSFMTPSQYKYAQEMEEGRRHRNNEILAKIHELQVNASANALRSEKLRQMRVSYESQRCILEF
jgi:hypothetical protein